MTVLTIDTVVRHVMVVHWQHWTVITLGTQIVA